MASSAGSAMVARIQMVGEKVRQAYTKPSLLGNRYESYRFFILHNIKKMFEIMSFIVTAT